MSSVTLKTLKETSSHGTTIIRLVNKIENYSTEETLQMDATQLNDFLASLKKCSDDYFETHAIIDKCDSKQAAKKDVLVQQELTIETMLSSVCSDRCVKHIV